MHSHGSDVVVQGGARDRRQGGADAVDVPPPVHDQGVRHVWVKHDGVRRH